VLEPSLKDVTLLFQGIEVMPQGELRSHINGEPLELLHRIERAPVLCCGAPAAVESTFLNVG
jgi:hypothetical protein